MIVPDFTATIERDRMRDTIGEGHKAPIRFHNINEVKVPKVLVVWCLLLAACVSLSAISSLSGNNNNSTVRRSFVEQNLSKGSSTARGAAARYYGVTDAEMLEECRKAVLQHRRGEMGRVMQKLAAAQAAGNLPLFANEL